MNKTILLLGSIFLNFFLILAMAVIFMIFALRLTFAYLKFLIKNYYLLLILGLAISCVAHGKDCEIKVAAVQQHRMWCWLASSQMVLDANKSCYSGLDSKQESLMRLAASMGMKPWFCGSNPNSCGNEGADTGNTMTRLIEQASIESFKACGSPKIKAMSTPSSISTSEVRAQVCGGRPVLIGVTLSNDIGPYPQHAVVIVGMTRRGKLIIRDPWPYGRDPNPWVALGGKIRDNGTIEIGVRDLGKHWQDSMTFKKKEDDEAL